MNVASTQERANDARRLLFIIELSTYMSDIFCNIIAKEIPANIVVENDYAIAIEDIHPQAPVHVLIIPKKHITSIMDISPEDSNLMGKLFVMAQEVAKKLGLEYKGFRLITNQGEDGGQIIDHLHLHLLGGKKLGPKIVA
jgi:histidine triad (HIT) family protein